MQTPIPPSILSDSNFTNTQTSDLYVDHDLYVFGTIHGTASASELVSSSGLVSVNTSTPSVGQVLTSVSPTVATWQTPVVTSASNLISSTGLVSVNTTTPTVGQALIATSPTVATWQTISGGGTPGGSDTQVQYNSSGTFAGNAALTFDPNSISRFGQTIAGTLSLGNALGNSNLTANTGGNLYLSGGDTTGLNNGGSVNIVPGNAGDPSALNGNVNILGASYLSSVNGGSNVNITAGSTFGNSGFTGGSINITSGYNFFNIGSNLGGNGGDINLLTGIGDVRRSGNLSLLTGFSQFILPYGNVVAKTSGDVTIGSGNAEQEGGNVNISTGSANFKAGT